MPLWVLILIQVGLQILSGLLSSKGAGKPETKPQLPQTDATTPIAVPFGECLLKGSQLMDYFDFRAVPIKIRNPATFFITTLTTGYKYYLGMVFGLGWGKTPQGNEGCRIRDILIDNRSCINLLLGPGTGAGPVWQAVFNAATPLYINKPSFFGAENREGGVYAKIIFYSGEDYVPLSLGEQFPNPYWESQRGQPMPNYKDLCYAVWHGPSDGLLPGIYGGKLGGLIGTNVSLWPIAFKISRQPVYHTAIGRMGDGDTGLGDHANPVECLVECLTNNEWGSKISRLQLYEGGVGIKDSFFGAAQVVFAEKLSFSYLWTSSSAVQEMIDEICRYINGMLWQDLETGQIKLTLARDDYDPDTLRHYSNDSFTEITSFTRGSWEDTKNQVRVSFPDHARVDFEDNTAWWQDLANVQIQGLTEPVEIEYKGCPTMAIANRLAARDGRVYATPLAKLTGKIDRKAWKEHPGSVFKFSWPEQGIENMIMRVMSMKFGTITEDVVELACVEDVFSAGSATFGNPVTTVWTDPVGADAEDPEAAAGEVPYWMQRDDIPRIFGVATRSSTAEIDYDGALDHTIELARRGFTPFGTLVADYPQLDTTDYDTTGFDVENAVLPDEILAGSAAQIAAEGRGLFLVGDPAGVHEWMAAQVVTDNLDGTVTLDNVWRGLLDTPPIAHVAGAKVWFFGSGGVSLFPNALVNLQTVVFEALTHTINNQLTTTDATDHPVTMRSRALRPLPPYYVTLAGDYTDLRQDTGDVVLAWREHSRLAMSAVLKQSATTESPEAGVTYEIDIYGLSGTLLRSVTGLTSPTYTYTNVNELADNGTAILELRLLFRIYSKRDGWRSLYPWDRYVYRVDPGTVVDPAVRVNGILVTVGGVIVTQT